MSDPVRIREAGDVPEELRELFRSAAKPQPLTSALGAMLSSRVAGMAAATAPTPVFGKALLWLLGGAVAFGGVVAYRAERVELGAPTPPAPAPVLAPAPALAPEPPAPAAEPPSRALSTRPAPPSAASAAEDGLVGEERLLNEAHEALAASPKRALALAQSHARRYPHGQLVAERDLITIEALVGLGRRREAEALGRDLRKTAPNNIYEERLDQILRTK